LGGSANYFSIAASNFTPIQVVGVVGEDFPKTHLDFMRERGIDTAGIQQVPGKTFHWQGEYKDDMNQAITHLTALNVFEHFNPKLPSDYLSADYLFLGNIAPELQMSVLDQVKRPKLIALDSMNFWISGARSRLLDVLKRIDLLIINDGEAKLLGDSHNLLTAIERVAAMGPKAVVVKRGEYGSITTMGGEYFAAPALPLRKIVDPTGAGDTFAGGLMGYLAKVDGGLDRTSLKKGILHGTVMASFTVEDFGLGRLKTVTNDEINDRYRQLLNLISV
jgi:sugar/nucleoside kinase (ribokinase family)